jgi:hypothetical protein
MLPVGVTPGQVTCEVKVTVSPSTEGSSDDCRLVVVGETPFPSRATVDVLLLALSNIFRVAVRSPTPAGVNATVMVVKAPGSVVIGNVLDVKVNSAALVPPIPMLLMTRFAVPVLVTVTLLEALLTFMVWFLKFIELGLTEAVATPIGKATVDQLSAAFPNPFIQFAVAVFRIVPVAVLLTCTTIVIVSVSPLAIEPKVTVALLPVFWQVPWGVIEQLLKTRFGSKLSTTVTLLIAAAVLFVTTIEYVSVPPAEATLGESVIVTDISGVVPSARIGFEPAGIV